MAGEAGDERPGKRGRSSPARRPIRRDDVVLCPLPDGSGVLFDAASGAVHALNASGAAIWELCDGQRTPARIAAELLRRYDAPPADIRAGVAGLLRQLRDLDVLETGRRGEAVPEPSPEAPPAAPSPEAVDVRALAAGLPHRARYDLLGYRVEVATDSDAFHVTFGRLCSEQRSDAAGPLDACYAALAPAVGRGWRLLCEGQAPHDSDDLLDAIRYVEWQACTAAIDAQADLLHVHGAALAGPSASLLMPGGHGAGKTTLALALAARGPRLLSDDVSFVQPGDWRPVPFPRPIHVRDDGLTRLAAIGVRFDPDDRLGVYLRAAALGRWERAPGPPLRYVVLPRLRRGDTSAPRLEPVTDAEVAVELIGCSKSLRRAERRGLLLLPSLLAQVESYVLRFGEDLAAASDLVRGLLAQ